MFSIKSPALEYHVYGFGDTPFYIPSIKGLPLKFRFITTAKIPFSHYSDFPYECLSAWDFLNTDFYDGKISIKALLRKCAFRKAIKCFSKNPALYTYDLSRQDEIAIRDEGWSLLSNSFALKEWLENKLFLPSILARASLDHLPYLLVDRKAICGRLLKGFSKGTVAQLPANNLNGRGTFFIKGSKNVRSVLSGVNRAQKLKLTRFVNGINVNTSACVTRHGTFVAGPFLQFVGISGLTAVRGGHCGNQLATNGSIADSVTAQLFSETKQVGECLHAFGYKGCFGIDFIIDDDNKVHIIELNPRAQSTTGLLNSIQENQNIPSFALLHILEHLNAEYILDEKIYQRKINLACRREASQLVIFNCKKRFKLSAGLFPGIYCFDGKNILFRRLGFSINELFENDEFLVTRYINPGCIVERHQMLCILQFKRAVVPCRSSGLDNYIASLCRTIRSYFI